ncbi:MAG: alpha/beta hydrolase [Sphingomonadales bacterium]
MGDLNGVAVRRREGAGPTIVFLPGYASDMAGTKAVALDAWAARNGRAFVRFDYRGCGESAGAFEDFTLEDWRDDALAVIDSVAGPVVLVGSSMGGWIMMLAALARPERVSALVGLAAAPDFTEWGFTAAQKAAFVADGRVLEPSIYGPPLITIRGFWEAGQRNLLLDAGIAIDVPVRLIQGQRDADVPWQNALTLADHLRSADVQVHLIKDGDHRLSRDVDIALLIRTIESLP